MTSSNDKLTIEDIENIEATMKVGGKFHKPINLSIALQQLAELLRENERLKSMIMSATKPQIFGASSVVGIPELAYNAMRDYRNKESDNG